MLSTAPSTALRFVFAGAAGFGVIVALWTGGPTPVESVASGLLGERWYRVELHGRSVGEYVSRGARSRDGYRFGTELRFDLGTGGEVHIADTLSFDGAPDHALREAIHVFANSDARVRVLVERQGGRLHGGADGQSRDLTWDYRLADYVALESWLADGPPAGAQTRTRSIDLGRLEVNRETWRLAGRNDVGYRMRQAAPLGDIEVQLDANLAPLHFDLAGVFSMQRVSGPEEAAAWRATPGPAAPVRYAVPLDAPLAKPRELTLLTLRVNAPGDADVSAWPALRPDGNGQWLLTTGDETHRSVRAEERAPLSRATPSLPTDSPAIERLAARAVRDAHAPSDQLDALVAFVHRYVEYVERDAVQTVADTLRTRLGDCTEYADLLTTMARALGLPARTVTGLAYDADRATFALHSWNEVAVEGRWQGVDPTWDQVRLDATHIALPEDRALAVLGLLPQLAFEFVAAEYGDVGAR